jgi:hypothetical protein
MSGGPEEADGIHWVVIARVGDEEWHVGVYTSEILVGDAALRLADNIDVGVGVFPISELNVVLPFQGSPDDLRAGLTADC